MTQDKPKTAMQIVYDFFDIMGSDEFCQTMIRKRNELLEKEKTQIVDAFKDGFLSSETSSEYYDKTYKQ